MLDIINIYNFVLIRGATLSTNALVLESSVLIAVCNHKMVMIPFSPNFLQGNNPTMVLRSSWHKMVIWLYFNHILNNFVVILTYTFMIAIIKFVVSMVENVVLEARTVEEEHMGATISTVSTSAPGK